jgi:stage V sporulation protein B
VLIVGPRMAEGTKKIAARAGIGGIAVLGAKVFFILTGFVQQALLPRFIGRAGWGALALVMAPSNIVNNVVIAGSTQSASRAVAGAPGREDEAQRAAMRVHVPMAIVAGVLFALAAWPIAWFEHDPYLVLPLATMSLVLLFYGLYAPFIGVLNGRGLFVKQATLDMMFATMRTVGLLGVGWLFVRRGLSGALGSTVGFAMAAATIALVAGGFVRAATGKPDTTQTAGPAPLAGAKYLAVLFPLALAQFFTNALMQVDIILLGRFLHGATRDAKSADEWVAVYRACQLFAFLPYQLLLSLTQILFPMLARAKAEGSSDEVREYVARGSRLGAIAMGAMVAVVAGMPETAIRFAYDPDMAARGASTLRVLALGQGAFTLLGIGCTVLSSLGRERTSAALTATAAACAGIVCAVVVPGRPFGASQLHATAFAMCAVLVVALVVCAVLVVRAAGSFVPLRSAARVLVALALVVAAGTHVPAVSRALAPIVAVGLAGAYLLVLAVSREIGVADARWVASALRRGKSRKGGAA